MCVSRRWLAVRELADDAIRALETLNYAPLNGKSIRVMHSNRDPSSRRSGMGNIFIKNLDKEIDNKALYDTFAVFGNILSCKIVTDSSGQSKGYGFVQFDKKESAQDAIEKLNGMHINDKPVFVGQFLRKQDRESTVDKTKFTNVFVKNLSEKTTEDDLHKIFGEFGIITSAVVRRDGEKSKCFGFVNFENADAAAKSVESLSGEKFDEKVWYVGKAQKKSEREQELKERYEQNMREAVDRRQIMNLYLKNLDESINDDKLKELFSKFGTITSSKVMCEDNGASKGYGFVAFSTPNEASRALQEMRGKMVAGKPLYVAPAQRKEDRKARLQAQFLQAQSGRMEQISRQVPMYPPDAQPTFCGQGPRQFINSQPQINVRPSEDLPPVRNFFVTNAQQGQERQSSGGRHMGIQSTQQGQPLMPVAHQLYMQSPHGSVHGHGSPDALMGGVLPGQYDMGRLLLREAAIPPSVPIGALASVLANAPPEQQQMILGESLYPLVRQLEPAMVDKVTGMLLEMDKTEILHLLESPDALKIKVGEAMEVLKGAGHPLAPATKSAALHFD